MPFTALLILLFLALVILVLIAYIFDLRDKLKLERELRNPNRDWFDIGRRRLP